MRREKIMNSLAPLVCIVDDNPVILDYLTDLLQSPCWEVKGYQDGSQFLASRDFDRPGCIIMELRMPYLGGLEILAQLIKSEVDWPVIFLNGYDDFNFENQARLMGAVAFLKKTFPLEDLIDVVRYWVKDSVAKMGCKKHTSKDNMGIQERNAKLEELKQRFKLLSHRQREIIELMIAGNTKSEIATRLGISLNSVKTHSRFAYHNLGVCNSKDLTTMFNGTQLLDIFDDVKDKAISDTEVNEFIKKIAFLTERQRQIVKLIGDGKSVKNVADELRILPKSVHCHLYNIYSKLGISKLSTLIRMLNCLRIYQKGQL